MVLLLDMPKMLKGYVPFHSYINNGRVIVMGLWRPAERSCTTRKKNILIFRPHKVIGRGSFSPLSSALNGRSTSAIKILTSWVDLAVFGPLAGTYFNFLPGSDLPS